MGPFVPGFVKLLFPVNIRACLSNIVYFIAYFIAWSIVLARQA